MGISLNVNLTKKLSRVALIEGLLYYEEKTIIVSEFISPNVLNVCV